MLARGLPSTESIDKVTVTKLNTLSVVATLYNSHETIKQFVHRVTKAAKQVAQQFEIVLVDDGSTDDTIKLVRNLADQGLPIVLYQLSRNFGHHAAMLEGVKRASGDFVFLIDCDLEEAPELIIEFHNVMHEKSADVVYGVQKHRKRGKGVDKLLGSLFYSVYNSLSEVKIPPNLSVTRLMKREYVAALSLFSETEMIVGSIWSMAGFKQYAVDVDVEYKGHSSYSMRRRISMAIEAIISTSTRPLKLYFILSLLVVLISALAIFWIMITWLVFDRPVPGFYTLVISIWFACGFLSSGVGLLGMYLSVIMKESKNRPRAIVRSVFTGSGHKQLNLNEKSDKF